MTLECTPGKRIPVPTDRVKILRRRLVVGLTSQTHGHHPAAR
ncbi:hypothetical protein SCATT_04710 [Streptantibioticus cattleyicolor NRRL 8057 = DSM 46488]|uniref:Uncharacterized protein n=1 Tax=Streptantibioticus cattleyicolor (strain ATCC 35852 / DSM 46488 / JCM 4925 / NBRC 14057 / NRRL 8057) TaxID=1003195 RepID=G8WPQ3_STREN|nr:hypothetical protein SCATT_04710 [Streptantibioticus cattleyicolor NRRL 8057 = DSM 46488]